MRMIFAVGALVVALVPPGRLSAQTLAGGPALPRFDASVSLGWYGASENVPGRREAWYGGSLHRSFAAGFYWTEHHKTDIEASWTGQGRLYADHPDASVAQQTSGYAEYNFSTRSIGLAQRYQFGHNQYFHPNVAVGALFEWNARDVELGPLYTTRGVLIAQPRRNLKLPTELRTTPFVSTGFKAYLTERAFFRSDVRVGFARSTKNAAVTFGVGVDF